MPTKRRRRTRAQIGLTPEERQWLTGQPVAGAGKLWAFRGGAAKAERCREIIRAYAELIPRGRLAQLERDIERWDDPKPRGLASFR
jgi:hypothetical protein